MPTESDVVTGVLGTETDPYDVIGVGFGPSNLALAIAVRELGPGRNCLFLERNPSVRWHPGMLIDGARMQISFLKDLVSLRNPASPYTFLQYAKARDRLEMFVNLNEFRPTRVEYEDYLRWVAGFFADQVAYDTEVTGIELTRGRGLFRVSSRNVHTGRTDVRFAANVVYAAGGRPRIPAGAVCDGAAVVHSSQFLPNFPARFDDHGRPYEFAVAGDGQSGGEIAEYLLRNYPAARVHLVLRGYALRGTDNSPFVNEQFYGRSSDRFRAMPDEARDALLTELRNTNYGVVEAGFIDQLYRQVYADEVNGRRRLLVHPGSRLCQVDRTGYGVRVDVEQCHTGRRETFDCDGVVLATGYERRLPPEIFDPLAPLIERDSAGRPMLSDDYRVRLTRDVAGGLYLQGFGEHMFGLGDTLLSLLPFRSERIVTDVCQRTPPASVRPPRRPSAATYPPRRYLEQDPAKLYPVLRRFNFATVVSARGAGDPVVTHVPMTLDLSRGEFGVLFGHMDRTNPHVELIAGQPVTVLFHGPNSYLSPDVFTCGPLPTWNSISVHVRGRGRLIDERDDLVRGLCDLAEQSDANGSGYRLRPDDPRIDKLIEHVVGFEIEIARIVGRYKLSQELDDGERRRAARELARTSVRGEDALIEHIVGLPMSDGHRNGFHHKEVRHTIPWRA